MVGATIMIEGSKSGVTTDVEGTFFIVLELGKSYNLIVSNIGYESKIINDVKPSREINEPINVPLALRSATNSVVVRSTTLRESIASLYTVQKAALLFQMEFLQNPFS